MPTTPPVFLALAAAYETTPAGRTGEGRGVLIDYEDLLTRAGATRSDSRQQAEAVLIDAHRAGSIELERHAKDEQLIMRVRLRPEQESLFYAGLGSPSPRARRNRLAQDFLRGLEPEIEVGAYNSEWSAWCQRLAMAAHAGSSIEPFSRTDDALNRDLLRALPQLLVWRGDALRRLASSVIYRDSKRLERRQRALETCLAQITSGAIASLADLGITENPRTLLVAGPVRLHVPGGVVDCGLLHGPAAVSEIDLLRVSHVTTTATRLITVENPTMLLELARLRSGDLLIGTSYVGRGTRQMLALLPCELASWHFGDSDPAGFDVLRNLRARTGRPFASLHMAFRDAVDSEPLSTEDAALLRRLLDSPDMNDREKSELRAMRDARRKGWYEQESLGRPSLRQFPYYAERAPAEASAIGVRP